MDYIQTKIRNSTEMQEKDTQKRTIFSYSSLYLHNWYPFKQDNVDFIIIVIFSIMNT